MIDIKKKLRSRSGETLSEALISVLIVSLASVMLATMISAASSMNLRTKKYDEALDEALIAMSMGTPVKGEVVIKVNDVQIGDPIPVEVKSYSPEDGDSTISLSSYSREEENPENP